MPKTTPISDKPAPKPYIEPVKPKESLRTLLDKLSIEPEKPKAIAKANDGVEEKLEKTEKTENQGQPHISSPHKSRTPDPQKIADLRALLQKVVPKHDEAKKDDIKKAVPPTKQADPRGGDTKEVPEEVLRSILGS